MNKEEIVERLTAKFKVAELYRTLTLNQVVEIEDLLYKAYSEGWLERDREDFSNSYDLD